MCAHIQVDRSATWIVRRRNCGRGNDRLDNIRAGSWEVATTWSDAQRLHGLWAGDHVPVKELARRQGVGPIASADELVCPGMFESYQELEEFIIDL